MPSITLTDGQQTALKEILKSYHERQTRHLLTGYAGTGKTTLLQEVVKNIDKRVVVTAPTNKAVHVIHRKLQDAGIYAECMTIHSLLGVSPQTANSEKKQLKRVSDPKFHKFNCVIIDECSMISSEIQKYIDDDLFSHWVLYVGDPAQLPPIGETEAACFSTPNKSNLSTIVRQAESNPIIQASVCLRERLDWSWCKQDVRDDATGIYTPEKGEVYAWMKEAFTSHEFAQNNDFCRYLAYTNKRAIEINTLVRGWVYGKTETPFVEGEMVVTRKPITDSRGKPVFAVNDEMRVETIKRGQDITMTFPDHNGGGKRQEVKGWQYKLPVWEVSFGPDIVCRVPVDQREYDTLCRRVKAEAAINSARWWEFYTMVHDPIADIRHVYAMTIHTSQGSTFDNVFIDINDCQANGRANPDELRKLLYVAVTRPRETVTLVQ